MKNIRYFFMLGISNEQTNQLIASCLTRAKKELSEWPGTSFDTSTDEGHALLSVDPLSRQVQQANTQHQWLAKWRGICVLPAPTQGRARP